LHDVLVPGDQIEVRGPIGGYFVWYPGLSAPLLLVGGGSGVVPLMAMLRHRRVSGTRVPTRLLYSVRGPDDVIYADELIQVGSAGDGLAVVLTYTRAQPPEWTGYARRIDRAMLGEVSGPLGEGALAYVCGPTLLVESVANDLVAMGATPSRVR